MANRHATKHGCKQALKMFAVIWIFSPVHVSSQGETSQELKLETFVGGEMNQSAGCGWSDYWMQHYTFEAVSLFCLSNFLGVFQ